MAKNETRPALHDLTDSASTGAAACGYNIQYKDPRGPKIQYPARFTLPEIRFSMETLPLKNV
jgi:hypothetical protein